MPDIDIVREWARERLDALYTEQAARLGESRWAFMEQFFSQFAHETSTTSKDH